MSSGFLSSACAKCRSYQHPCSMTPTSVCCHITDKHIVIIFLGFAQPRLKLLLFAESMHVTGMRVYRFKRVHLPCPCGQLFVQVFPPSPMLRHCAICNRAGNQEAHTQEHTWLITTRQNSPHPSNDSPPPPQRKYKHIYRRPREKWQRKSALEQDEILSRTQLLW